MEDLVMARRNGKYTCLDCTKQLTDVCRSCKNWDKFELDEEVSFDEKIARYERKKKKWTVKQLRNGLEPESETTSETTD